MKRRLMLAMLSGAILAAASTAVAEDVDQCENTCPDGQQLAGFADGNRATCLCVDPSPGMDETVPVAVENPGPGDGEPTAATAPDPTVDDPAPPEPL